VCKVEPDDLYETLNRFFASIVKHYLRRQRLVELQSLAGLCETTEIETLRFVQSVHKFTSYQTFELGSGVSTNPPASNQPESPPFSENTFWYPIFWSVSAAKAPLFPSAQ
jgi:hypothetical protein